MLALSDTFGFSQLQESDFIDFKYGWNLAEAPLARYFLGLSSDRIFFTAKIFNKPDYDKTLNKYDFIEGLWQQDVLELFVGDYERGCYQEFNIAPSGAWWSAFFSKYRIEDKSTNCKINSIKIEVSINDIFWQASIVIPIKSLSFDFNSDKAIINPTAICRKSGRIYFSAIEIKSLVPDFHLFLS